MPDPAPDQHSRVREAVTASRRGWSLTPLDGKKPILSGWQDRPTPSEADILEWAAKGNVGLRTGPASGIFVIDVDDGDIKALFPDGPPWTYRVQTRPGRFHLYFQAPDPCPGNSAGKLAPGIDTRGTGGQVVYPGSIHPDTGDTYRWVPGYSPDDVPGPAQVPKHILALLVDEPLERQAPQTHTTAQASDAYADRALHSEIALVCESQEGSRNHALNRAAFNLGQLVAGGVLSHVLVAQELEAAALSVGLGPGETEKTIRSGMKSGANSPRTAPERPTSGHQEQQEPARMRDVPPPSDADHASHDTPAVPELPVIMVPGTHITGDGEEVEVSNGAFVDACLASLPPEMLYRRAGVAGELIGPPGGRKFRSLINSRTRIIVDHHARLIQWRPRPNTNPVRYKAYFRPCSRDHGTMISDSAANHPGIRDLRLIVRYPVFLGHDFHLAAPGWNDADRVFYDQPVDLRDLRVDHDGDTIHLALNALTEDFPWKSPADRQNFYGLLLTPLIRPALQRDGGGNTPLHLILSSLERTGKSKLAEQVLGGVVLGHSTPAMQLSGSEEERDKRITTALMAGKTLLHFDNLREFLDSASLSSLLTSSMYSGRVLGASVMSEQPNTLTLVASGNNVTATGEIVKRTVPIQLQPTTDRPEDRSDFQHPDLPAYVKKNRRHILGCLISAVNLWREAGAEQSTLMKGGFEEWSATVGGILRGLIFTDWRTNERAWIRSADPRGEDLRTLVLAWWETMGTAPQSPSWIYDLAQEQGIFQRANAPKTPAGAIASFSRVILARNADTPCAGFYIRKAAYGSNSAYFLEEIEEPDGETRD